MKKTLSFFLIVLSVANTAVGGLTFVRSTGITLTGADGVRYVGPSGITLTGADGFLTYRSNGITLTGADGITLTGADAFTSTGASGTTYTGPNGITLTGADGITLTGADGITLTGADGITLTGADGTQRTADSILVQRPNGITLTGADGITLTGADGTALTGPVGMTRIGTNGITLTGADGITLTGADGITLTGADGITLTGADSVIGFGANGVIFDQTFPAGITLTGADGITLTGADGVSMSNPGGITLTGVDGVSIPGENTTGLQSVDPELALRLNAITDDSSVNAVVVFHDAVTEQDLTNLRQIGILGGTRFRVLPMVYVSGTRDQILAVSRLASVRTIYGNRTLNFDSDPFFNRTGVQRVSADPDIRAANNSLPVSGLNVTVAVLDTGINSFHPDLAGKVVQNVRLVDTQSAPTGFVYSAPVENIPNTDLAGGHGTFVAGIVAASGANSGGRFSGVAPGSKLLGLSAGDINLMYVLSGFDYLLENAAAYNVRVVNCSFSANTVYDVNDPVNIATKMLTGRGVNVVFSAGNSGSGNGTLNPYAAAPWVVSVGATDQNGRLASFSSRGNFGDDLQHPSLVAPGVNVASLRSSATATGTTGLGGADTQRLQSSELPYYTTGSGTSFSAPQVAGAIALMLEANPNLSPAEVKDILSRTSTPLPRYFYHEAGAGMLNTHAAVRQAAFNDQAVGAVRSTLLKNSVRFITSTTQSFTQMVFPEAASSVNVQVPQNTVQASVDIAWGLSANDFGLKLYNSSDALVDESNVLNLPGLTGRREKVVLRNPADQTLRAAISHTGSIGTGQNVFGSVEVTRAEYPNLNDLDLLSPAMRAEAQRSLVSNVMLPEGRRYRPAYSVSRSEFAAAFVRTGLVPQFLARNQMFIDVRDRFSRNAVESVQSNPDGKLIFDASPGGRFYPHANITRLAAAIAFVKAAGLEDAASTATLPSNVADGAAIPSAYRGSVAIALQRGFLTLDGNFFDPGRALARMEMAGALNILVHAN